MINKLFLACFIFSLFTCMAITAHAQNWTDLLQKMEAHYNAGRTDSALFYGTKALARAETEFGKADVNYATSLNGLANVYYSRADYALAEPLYTEAVAIYKSTLGTEHLYYAIAVSSLGNLYNSMGNYQKAEPLFTEALTIYKKTAGAQHSSYPETLNNLGNLYKSMGSYRKAEPLYEEALGVYKNTLGAEHQLYATTLNNLANLYGFLGNYTKAEQLGLEALNILKKALGTEHLDYASSLSGLAHLYSLTGNYVKAESLYTEALTIYKKNLGPEHPYYATLLSSLAYLSSRMGNYAKAEVLYMQAIAVYKKTIGMGHPDYAMLLNNLAGLYKSIGNYAKAEPLYTESAAILKGTLGTTHSNYAHSLDGLAGLYENMGDFAKAESLFLDALAISKQAVGTEHVIYGNSINNLANLYLAMGNYSKARSLYAESTLITKKSFGDQHPDYASALNNLAGLYTSLGDYPASEQASASALNIYKNMNMAEHPEYVKTLFGLGFVNVLMGNYNKAELMMSDALSIHEKTSVSDHLLYSKILVNLGYLSKLKGNYTRAESFYLKGLALREKNLGKEHPEYAVSLHYLGDLYAAMGNNEKARENFLLARNLSLTNITNNFSFLSESEREQYLAKLFFRFERYQSFFLNLSKINPSISAEAYDIELATKGMILSSAIQIKQAAAANSDPHIASIYDKWITLKTTIGRVYSLPVSKRPANIDSIENQANGHEKELARLSSTFGEGKLLIEAKWKSIQQTLKPGEAAIEFAAFQYYDGKRKTDTTQYIALILRKESLYPAMVSLCTEKQLDSLLISDNNTDKGFIAGLYRGGTLLNTGTSAVSRRKLYQLVWKPLENILKPGDHIYFAPSGLLHQVAFAAVAAEDGVMLSERYRLSQLSSTAMLLQPPKPLNKSDMSVAAFGGIQYDASSAELMRMTPKNKQDFVSRALTSDGTRGSAWNYLPGTLQEIKDIDSLAKLYKVPSKTYTGATAMEENYKNYGSVPSPRIIHISTHGFFFPDPKKVYNDNDVPSGEKQAFRLSDNPLNRSGLLFAGANRVWQGEAATQGLEDGILTAYEASNVMLNNTRLVVLSACETGLGDIKGSEGVFGLQRAFKAAGADYLMMSLWKVPDTETAEFMTGFYRSLFSGETVHGAFNFAQAAMQKKYRDDPYKWAAFVLVR